MSQVGLDVLGLFLHLSRSLHFGRTARACHISPSALSRSMQRLEEQVEAVLFERDRRHVRLTLAGQRLQRYAIETLDGWERLRSDLRAAGETLRGSLSLYCTVTAAHSVLPAVLGRFRQSYPEVTLELRTGDAIEALEVLQEGAVDASVAALPARLPRGLVARDVTRTALRFVAPRAQCEVTRLLEQDPVDWARVPMVLPERGIARRSIDGWFQRRHLTPQIYGEVSGNEAALSLISLGCGVGIVPALVMDKSPLRSEVRTLDVKPALPDFRVGICTRRTSLGVPVVAAFWDSISSDTSI
ncbi:MAG: HTH-type transcriptional activator IlvY [Myxococcales bacterium]|nr:HTH-type transcriptional activator IlvY [Myxococcales bacterium]